MKTTSARIAPTRASPKTARAMESLLRISYLGCDVGFKIGNEIRDLDVRTVPVDEKIAAAVVPTQAVLVQVRNGDVRSIAVRFRQDLRGGIGEILE